MLCRVRRRQVDRVAARWSDCRFNSRLSLVNMYTTRVAETVRIRREVPVASFGYLLISDHHFVVNLPCPSAVKYPYLVKNVGSKFPLPFSPPSPTGAASVNCPSAPLTPPPPSLRILSRLPITSSLTAPSHPSLSRFPASPLPSPNAAAK